MCLVGRGQREEKTFMMALLCVCTCMFAICLHEGIHVSHDHLCLEALFSPISNYHSVPSGGIVQLPNS